MHTLIFSNLSKTLTKYVKHFDEITHFEADVNYTHIHLQNGEQHTVSCTLKRFEEMLENTSFLRIHRSYIVNPRHIKKSNRNEVLMSDGLRLPVARRRRV
ncbi:LytR/AlgR family response regulator transcription factor [Arcticibacterium luteifluviistationis]|uniref:HTH LytTR-type domain-containing protein n=1 Tax=Arcticibacterium luteifluviistationis TaxID=1784714 RepID=A0A2Z4GD53_9BACT|nr:LytTR family DNA-binding domain-containing protein [Arcticibacterium luteifluviistationis]AWV99030.1 hypothetical protein DJ013_12985 [Arcticibacterium luteifluviistationis]